MSLMEMLSDGWDTSLSISNLAEAEATTALDI